MPGHVLAVATFAFASIAGAADFPKGAISIVVPAAPGGGTDLSARVFAKYAQKVLGQPVVVVNVSGGGGSSGTKKVYDAKPDGANILFFHNNVVLNNISGVASYSYDGFEVGPRMVTDAAMGLFVNKSSGWNTINDFIEYCGQNPGKATVATEIGGYTYFFLLSLQDKTGVEFNIVDVGGNSEKSTALLGGHIDAMPNSYGTAKGFVQSGDFVCLGFPTEERNPVFPEVPTYKEQGVDYTYPAYEFSFFFPKGTHPDIQAKLDQAVKKVSENAAAQKDIARLGFVMHYVEPKENVKVYAEMQDLFTDRKSVV